MLRQQGTLVQQPAGIVELDFGLKEPIPVFRIRSFKIFQFRIHLKQRPVITEPAFVNFYGAQESIPRNRFHARWTDAVSRQMVFGIRMAASRKQILETGDFLKIIFFKGTVAWDGFFAHCILSRTERKNLKKNSCSANIYWVMARFNSFSA